MRPPAPTHCFAISAPASAPGRRSLRATASRATSSRDAGRAAARHVQLLRQRSERSAPRRGKAIPERPQSPHRETERVLHRLRRPSSPILLDAIARSDGTRASVTKQLFKTNVKNGILGNISFDKNGDPIEAPVTIYRIVGPGSDQKGRVVDRVITARTAALP